MENSKFFKSKGKLLIGFISCLSIITLKGQQMEKKTVVTSIGEIACYIKEVPGSTPILFLHGVYYDHHLWNYYLNRIEEHTIITLDMPLHGNSQNISKKDWSMEDCAQMLIDILDELKIEQCIAIGHSWGSMTILRAAHRESERFLGLGLCNMPLESGSTLSKMKFGFQHLLLPFRNFYSKQVGKVMFSKEKRLQKPEMQEYLHLNLANLSAKAIRKIDKEVISNVESGFPYLFDLTVPSIALKGNEDYVPDLNIIEMIEVEGKHTSPLEQPEEVLEMIQKVIALTES